MQAQRLLVLVSQPADYEPFFLGFAAGGFIVHIADDVSGWSAADLAAVTVALAEPGKMAPVAAKMPSLRWLQSTFAGVDALKNAALPEHCVVSNLRGVFGQAMAEYVFAQVISLERGFEHFQQQRQAQHWQARPYQTLAGQKMLILGTGSIAQHIAQLAQAFGMQCIGMNSTGREIAPFQRCISTTELMAELPHADVVVGVLPATPATVHLLSAAQFSAMKPSAVLVNVGRGSLVNETDLLLALDAKQLRHAILDVVQQEPLPTDHQFWHHPQITLTPHSAALSFPRDVMSVFQANWQRWLVGADIHYQVDLSRGY